jgi:hypothetical protein
MVAAMVPFAGTLLTVATIPHPPWAVVLAVTLMPAAAVLAARTLRRDGGGGRAA